MFGSPVTIINYFNEATVWLYHPLFNGSLYINPLSAINDNFIVYKSPALDNKLFGFGTRTVGKSLVWVVSLLPAKVIL